MHCIIGHSSITITMDIYSRVSPDVQQAAAEKLEKMLFGGSRAAGSAH